LSAVGKIAIAKILAFSTQKNPPEKISGGSLSSDAA
jgi:hypothetical protein